MMNSVRHFWWDLERFGLTPNKWRDRLTPRTGTTVLCIAIPKSGTHLLERCLCKLPGFYRPLIRTVHDANVDRLGGLDALLKRRRGGQVIVSHLSYAEERHRIAKAHRPVIIMMIRDPRDIVISEVHFIARSNWHELHTHFAGPADLKQKLAMRIRGNAEKGIPSIRDSMMAFHGWLAVADVVVRFEDMIGPKGGGSVQAQQDAIRRILAACGVDLTEGPSSLAGRLFSEASPTFRRGVGGQWRNTFDDELKQIFEAESGDVTGAFGYR